MRRGLARLESPAPLDRLPDTPSLRPRIAMPRPLPARLPLLLAGLPLLLAGLPGCATTSLALWATDHAPEDGERTAETARSLPQTQFRVEPGTLAPLHVACTQTTRWAQVHTEQHYHEWGLGWRILGGMFAVFEGTSAGLMLHQGTTRNEAGITTAGTLMAMDALATVALIVLKDGVWRARAWDGPKVLTSPRCPDHVTVEFADRTLPVFEAGQLAPADDLWFTDAILGVEGRARLHRPDGSFVDLRMTRQERCDAARLLGRPAAAWVCEPGR
jgi:hypothetical protein